MATHLAEEADMSAGKQTMNGDLAWYGASEVWIEAGHKVTSAAELRVAFGEGPVSGHQDFWIPFSGPDGTALGWMRFQYITTARQKALFAASEWRSASEPAPPEQDQLPLPLNLALAGFSLCR